MAIHSLGKYKVLDKLGQGNMGIVYRGERADGQFKKTVAIKLIRNDRLTAEAQKRFVQEQNILATLEHPNITQLFDAGYEKTNGSPYLVMEYIDGIPINDYCQANKLSTKEIIELFIKVCNGVSFAHQNVIIHRDLKPSNIMVTKSGEIKILDFGVAKLINDQEDHQLTRTGFSPFTPAYASPEQIQGKYLTTRSDIYALGVILYELLTEKPMFQREVSEFEIYKAIQETDPVKPSERALDDFEIDFDETVVEVSEADRKKNIVRHPHYRNLKGDLDKIILMALKKEPNRRYNSVDDLAQDLKNYLDSRPVSAQQDSFFYRTSRLVKRNKIGTILTAASGVLLASHVVFLQRDLNRTQELLEVNEETSSFLMNMFEQANPLGADGKPILARDLIDFGTENIDDFFTDQPLIKANVMASFGRIQRILHKPNSASKLLEESYKIRLDHDASPGERINSLINLAELANEKGDNKEALGFLEKATELLHLADQDSDCPPCLEVELLHASGRAHLARGEYKKADVDLAKAVDLSSHVSVEGKLKVDVLRTAALNQDYLGNVTKAVEMNQQALALNTQLFGEKNLQNGIIIMNLAETYYGAKKFEKAIELHQQSLQIIEQAVGKRHKDYAIVKSNLAKSYYFLKKLEIAAKLTEEAIEIQSSIYGEENKDLSIFLANLSRIKLDMGKSQEALTIIKRVIAIQLKILTPQHPELASSYSNYGIAALNSGLFDEAEDHFLKALKIDRVVEGDNRLKIAFRMKKLGEVALKQGRYDVATTYLEKSQGGYRELDPAYHNNIEDINIMLAKIKKNSNAH